MISKHSRWHLFKLALIWIEIVPISSGAIRYGILGLSIVEYHNPAVGALALGGSTYILEWGSLKASSKWISENGMDAILKSLKRKSMKNESLGSTGASWTRATLRSLSERHHLSPRHIGKRLPLVLQFLILIEFGTVILLTIKQQVEPTRTHDDIISNGRVAVTVISLFLAAQGALLTLGTKGLLGDGEIHASQSLLVLIIFLWFGIAQYLIRRVKNF